MDAIEGDETPWSYMCASIFSREITEFGALWHGCDWETHRILDEEPLKDAVHGGDLLEMMTPQSDWEWLQPTPDQWKPCVEQEGNQITVTFLTFSGLEQEAIYRHIDVYSASCYTFESDRQVLAKGGGGFIF